MIWLVSNEHTTCYRTCSTIVVDRQAARPSAKARGYDPSQTRYNPSPLLKNSPLNLPQTLKNPLAIPRLCGTIPPGPTGTGWDARLTITPPRSCNPMRVYPGAPGGLLRLAGTTGGSKSSDLRHLPTGAPMTFKAVVTTFEIPLQAPNISAVVTRHDNGFWYLHVDNTQGPRSGALLKPADIIALGNGLAELGTHLQDTAG